MPITSDHRDQAVELVKALGMTYFIAPSEAETLCCYLNIKGKVEFVLSEDTDCLAYGANMIAFKDFKVSDEQVYYISNESIREHMGFDLLEFRDLCIMLGCDYNSRVKGYPPDGKRHNKPVGIGAKGAYHMVTYYRRIENMVDAIVDMEPLNYKRCRELLSIPEVDPVCDALRIPFNVKLKKNRLAKIINRDSLSYTMDFIMKMWEPVVNNTMFPLTP
jgi:flap endonuclease-1